MFKLFYEKVVKMKTFWFWWIIAVIQVSFFKSFKIVIGLGRWPFSYDYYYTQWDKTWKMYNLGEAVMFASEAKIIVFLEIFPMGLSLSCMRSEEFFFQKTLILAFETLFYYH